MLKFLDASTNGCHYYYFTGNNGELYYWRSNKSKVYNTCYDCGRIKGIKVLDYKIKKMVRDYFTVGNGLMK